MRFPARQGEKWREVQVDEHKVESPNAEDHIVEEGRLRFDLDALVDGVVLLNCEWLFEFVLVLL